MMGDHIEFPTLHWHLWLFTGSTWLIQGCVYAVSDDHDDIMYRIVGRHWYVLRAGYLLGLSFLSLGHQHALALTHKCTRADSQHDSKLILNGNSVPSATFAVPNVSAEFREFAKVMLGLKRGQQPLQCCEYK